MNKPDYEKIIEWLALVLKCPVCGSKYETNETDIIESREQERPESGMVMVHTNCANCHSSIIFNVAIEGSDIFSIGMMTDLTVSDTKRFRDSKPITIDEVISFHQSLNKFDSDFKSLS